MKNKVYVVWLGRETGIFRSWNKVQEATKGFSGAKYKAFPENEAYKALKEGWEVHYGQVSTKPATELSEAARKTQEVTKMPAGGLPMPTHEFLTVDAAYSQKTKQLQFRGVLSSSKLEVFHSDTFIGGSANIGEYLAIVEGLKFLRENASKLDLPMEIYSDSFNAISWYFNRAHRSDVIKSGNADPRLVMLMNEADEYLKVESQRASVEIKKWHTGEWKAEIAADFGRK